MDSIIKPSIWYMDTAPKDVTVSLWKHIFIYTDSSTFFPCVPGSKDLLCFQEGLCNLWKPHVVTAGLLLVPELTCHQLTFWNDILVGLGRLEDSKPKYILLWHICFIFSYPDRYLLLFPVRWVTFCWSRFWVATETVSTDPFNQARL